MPTTRPRHQVTETPEVARALDAAARRWPDEPRSRLLVRLLGLGRQVLEEEQEQGLRRRRAAVEASSGQYPDAFGPEYLAQLRKDWPR